MSVFDLSQLSADRQAAGRLYLEFLRQPALSVGLYELAAGATDPQRPHTEDEIYYVVRGRAAVRLGAEDIPIGPGSVVFVPARQEHRFHSISEDLTLLVVFAPAEGAAANG
jgi:mannose-6-phosphate isomerase-like protein (cupin superfamily)